MYSLSFDKFYVIIACWEGIRGRYSIKKNSDNHFNPHLPLSCLRLKVLHFLLSKINNLNSHFLYRWILSLAFPLRNHVTLLSSHQFLRACKDGRVPRIKLRFIIHSKYFDVSDWLQFHNQQALTIFGR